MTLLIIFFESPTSKLVSFYHGDEGASGRSNSSSKPNNTSNISIQQLERLSQQLPLEQLPEKIEGLTHQNNGKQKITVVIPGEQITTKIVQVPKGSKRHINQAIPYLLEEDLADPVEDLHFALSKPNAEGQLLCAIISKQLLDNYLEKLAAFDIHPSSLIPDYWLLPNSDSTEYRKYHQRHLIRLANNTGMVLPANTPEELLNQALALPETISETSSGTDSETDSATNSVITETLNDPQGLPSTQDRELPALDQLLYFDQEPINLLQGMYAAKTTQTNSISFKYTAIAASVCIALFMAYFVAMGWYFGQQAEQLEEEAKAAYREWFPNESRILNIRRQMTAHIKNSGHQQQDELFFSLTNAVSQAVNAESEKATIRHIRYDRNDATLQLELQARSMGYGHNLQDHIQKNGYAAEVLSANSNDEGVITRLKLSLIDPNKKQLENKQ